MKFEQLCIFLLAIHFSLYAEQFIYPVAAIDNEGKEILVVYQKSLDDIELWIWDSATKCAMKGLLSAYVPAGIKMLPSGAGFSFVDEGRLRVKNFYKRFISALKKEMYIIFFRAIQSEKFKDAHLEKIAIMCTQVK